jgi:uncharacterized membrane protein YkvA (DUF1232 family)
MTVPNGRSIVKVRARTRGGIAPPAVHSPSPGTRGWCARARGDDPPVSRTPAILRPHVDRTTSLPAIGGRVGLLAALPERRRLPAYTRFLWELARDARLPMAHRVLLVGGVAYLVSPIDVLPDMIPGVGEVDDAVVALALFETIVSGLPESVVEEKLNAAGLAREHLEADLARIRATTPAVVRGIARGLPHLAVGATTVVRTGGRIARGTGRVARGTGRVAGRASAAVERARVYTDRHPSTKSSTKEGPHA